MSLAWASRCPVVPHRPETPRTTIRGSPIQFTGEVDAAGSVYLPQPWTRVMGGAVGRHHRTFPATVAANTLITCLPMILFGAGLFVNIGIDMVYSATIDMLVDGFPIGSQR